MTVYDTIGSTYANTRRPDPRIAERITAALGDAGSVANIGAGTGSYESAQVVVAVEPSATMIAQRPTGSAPVVRAVAESLPIADKAVDVAMALLTVHHWTDLESGIAELRRIARERVVIFTWDQDVFRDFWLLRDYLPEASAFDDQRAVPVGHLATLLGGARVEPVPVPHDCADGFMAAYWRRPEAYLDPDVRAGISLLSQTEGNEQGLRQLAEDIAAGRWHDRHADLLEARELNTGYRLLIADV